MWDVYRATATRLVGVPIVKHRAGHLMAICRHPVSEPSPASPRGGLIWNASLIAGLRDEYGVALCGRIRAAVIKDLKRNGPMRGNRLAPPEPLVAMTELAIRYTSHTSLVWMA